jgi:predicted SAM-dependent methyltransferase
MFRSLRKKIRKSWKNFKTSWKNARKAKAKAAAAAAVEARRREQRAQLQRQIATARPLRLVVGAGGVSDPGWVATDIEDLNLVLESDWLQLFRPDSIETILAEHVWEHLTEADGLAAAQLCFRFLKPGGRLRIAIPDGCHPDPNYIEHVRVGGTGPGADDHKVLHTHRTLATMMERAGFQAEILEHWDEQGVFHATDWDPSIGMIRRSKRFDQRNADGTLRYTSLIVDGIKR